MKKVQKIKMIQINVPFKNEDAAKGGNDNENN